MKITVLANMKKDKNGDVLSMVRHAFEGKAELKIVTDIITPEKLSGSDIAVILGGDGTIIRAAKCAALAGVPVCGINLGKIGFLASADVEEISALANNLLTGNYKLDKRMILNASINGGANRLVLNDIAVLRGSYPKMINITMDVDGEHLDTFMADGVVVATPTGSTAYSLSAGGPVAMPTMEMMLVTPVCAYDMHTRSMVLPSEKTLGISLGKDRDFKAEVSFDGNENVLLSNNDIIKISKSEYCAKLVNFGSRSFYGVLRKKLGR